MKKLLALVILLMGGCLFAQAEPSDVVATINDSLEVTLSELQGEIRTLPKDQASVATTKDGVKQVLDKIVQRKLLANQARTLQVDTIQVIKEALRRSQDIVLADFLLMNVQNDANSKPVTEEEAKQVYAQNESLFYSIPQVELKQIVATSKDEADAIKAELDKGKDFDALMKKYPGNPDGARSGDLGTIPLNKLTQTVIEVVQGLEPGNWGGPIQIGNGWHFLYLISKTPAKKLSFEDVQKDLTQRIATLRVQNAVDSYIQSLVDESKITIDNSVLKKAVVPKQQPPAGK